MDMAAIAGSPQGWATWLSRMVETLAIPCRPREGRPLLSIRPYMFRLGLKFRRETEMASGFF